jgi:acetyl-CoA carboxylase carboxyltransferase component
MGMDDEIKRYKEMRDRARLAGGEDRLEAQHKKGKLTARERIEMLLDAGSFFEFNLMAESPSEEFDMPDKKRPGDALIAGWGAIEGRDVCIYAQDATVLGGSIGPVHGRKMFKVAELARKRGLPLIGLNDSAGARIQEGQAGPYGGEAIFLANTLASGIVPQVCCIMGACAGIAVYSPALMDFIIMVDQTSHMFITGPKVIEEVTGEKISLEDLGGSVVHAHKTGVIDLRAPTEEDCFKIVRELLSYLPSNHLGAPPVIDMGDSPERRTDELADMVPLDARQPYDIRNVIISIADANRFFELKPEFAKEAVIGFIRLAGHTIGVVSNQASVLGGSLTVDASDKCARHMRFCDAFNIPLLFLMDVPGYFPGVEQEHGGIIRHGAKMLYAFCEATVPKVTVIIRKGYGGGILAMGGSKSIGADMIYAWPGAEMGVVGAEAAVNVLHRQEIKDSQNPEETREKRIKEFRDQFANPYYSAKTGAIDDVIEPGETRITLIKAFRFLSGKREHRPHKKHGNIPL